MPFLPMLLALTGITLMELLPGGPSPTPQGVELALAYLTLLLPGIILGNMPQAWLGSRSPMRFSLRRALLLALWMAQANAMAVTRGGAEAMAQWGLPQEAAIGLLLLNFWLADTLSLQAFYPFRRGTLAGLVRQFAGNLAISLPMVVLALAGLALSALAALIPSTPGTAGLLPPWLEPLATLAVYLAVAGLIIPLLIPLCWRLRELDHGPTRDIIREELAANGVSVARVLNWPAAMTGSATAGVIGLLPRFRYLLFSDILSTALTADEIRSVTAHEATHLRQRHLWYFIAAILAYVLSIHVLLQALALAGLWLNYRLPLWATTLIEVGGLLLFLRFGLGFLSRNFERQADLGALRRMGLEAFRSALLKIGSLNHIAPEADNWHHYGIGRRLAYLEGARNAPNIPAGHDQRVNRIKLACIALLAAGLVAQAVFSSPGGVTYIIENVWLRGLEEVAQPSKTEIEGLHYLALQAFQRNEFVAAERFFRRLLEVSPHDAEIQNNLAWLLVTRPDAGAANLAEGLQLARWAAQTSDSAFIWDTLAEALHRGGRPTKAREAAARALRLAEQGKGRGNTPLRYYRERLSAMGQAEGGTGKIKP